MAVWTLIALPLHLQVALWTDGNAAQVSIGFVVPLQLQTLVKEADVWPSLLCVVLRMGVTACHTWLNIFYACKSRQAKH